MKTARNSKHSVSVPSNPAYGFWTNFLIFRNSSSNVAVNRAEGDFPRHLHEFAEISLALSGSSEHCIEGFRHSVEQGDFIIVAPGSRHGYSNSVKFKRMNIQVRREHYLKVEDSLGKTGFSVKFLPLKKKKMLEPLAPAEFCECLGIAKEMRPSCSARQS